MERGEEFRDKAMAWFKERNLPLGIGGYFVHSLAALIYDERAEERRIALETAAKEADRFVTYFCDIPKRREASIVAEAIAKNIRARSYDVPQVNSHAALLAENARLRAALKYCSGLILALSERHKGEDVQLGGWNWPHIAEEANKAYRLTLAVYDAEKGGEDAAS